MRFSTAFMLLEFAAILPKCSTCSCNLRPYINKYANYLFAYLFIGLLFFFNSMFECFFKNVFDVIIIKDIKNIFSFTMKSN